MNQVDLNRSVARATGETVTEIKRRGFGLLAAPAPTKPPVLRRAPRFIDWDLFDTRCDSESSAKVTDEPVAV